MIPNLEYGRLPHPRLEGCLEEHLSGAARTRHGWDLKTWALHFQEGLTYLEELVQPGRIVLYGGIMEHWSSIQPLLRTEAELVAAVLTETAGPLGAALSAAGAAQPL
jgi:predicted NBD/HSP70 family sugar kinase